MSKIFEALRKTESAIKHLAMPVLSQPAVSAEAAAALMPDSSVAEAQPDPVNVPTAHLRTEAMRIAREAPILPFDGTDSRASEQYRIIRTKLLHHPARPRMLMVSSPMPGDGKTITAINMAAALALQEGANVVVVDADLRRSSVGRMLGFQAGPGLSEVLQGAATLEEALVRTEQLPNLYVLPAGAAAPSTFELLASERWHSLLELFRAKFGFTIFDAPPVGAVADYDLLQLACDGVILVVRQDHTDRNLCRRALETVPKAKQVGIIFNCVEEWFLWKTNSYYYYSRNVAK